MVEHKNSKAKIAANNRYNAKVYDKVSVAVPKGTKAAIQTAAAERGETINSFINRLIRKELAEIRLLKELEEMDGGKK